MNRSLQARAGKWWCCPMVSAGLCSLACREFKQQAEPAPSAWRAALTCAGAWATDFPMAMFGNRGEDQLVVRQNPTAWGYKAWPGKEKGHQPRKKKQGGIRHLVQQDIRMKEMAAKAWEEKWLESVEAVGWVLAEEKLLSKWLGPFGLC